MAEQDFVLDKVTGEVQYGDVEEFDFGDEVAKKYPIDPWNLSESESEEPKLEAKEDKTKGSEDEGFLTNVLNKAKAWFSSTKESDVELTTRVDKLEKEKAQLTSLSEAEKAKHEINTELSNLAESLGLDDDEQKGKFVNTLEKLVTTTAERLVKESVDKFESKYKEEQKVNEDARKEVMEVSTFYNGQTAPNASAMKPLVEHILEQYKDLDLLSKVSLFDLHKMAELTPFLDYIESNESGKKLNFGQKLVASRDLYLNYYNRAAKILGSDYKFTGYEHLDKGFNDKLSKGELSNKQPKRRSVEVSTSSVTGEPIQTKSREEIFGAKKVKTAQQVVEDSINDLLS